MIMKPVAKYVYCQTKWEDFHRYPNAPEEVAFLRTLHRHEFHIKLSVAVSHDDREVEFIIMKRWVEAEVIPELKKMWEFKSCEMMCEKVAELVFEKWEAVDKATVEISEDGENGSYVTFLKTI